MGARMRALQHHDLVPLKCSIFLWGSLGALTAPAKFLLGQRWPPARHVTVLSLISLGHKLQARCRGVCCHEGWGVRVGGTSRGEGGRFRKLRDMAPFPILLGDNKKGMLEKGKQREESTKTKAWARSV